MRILYQGYWLIVMSAVFQVSGCASMYSYNSVEVYVVDVDTKQPLEDVIVVAHWTLDEGTLGGNVEIGTLQVMETVSDKNGRVYFPEWGPKTVWRGRLDARGAQLHFFKPGYEITGGGNTDFLWQSKHPRTSQWNGLTVELKKFDGSQEKYAKQLTQLNTSLGGIIAYAENCEWKHIPKMVIAMQKEKEILEEKGIDTSGIRRINLFPSKNCGSPTEYFSRFNE